MGTVTEICAQKKNKSRVNISIDGEHVCGLDAFTALSHGIKVGKEITAKELEEVQLASDSETAFSKAVNYLGVRMRSKNEIIRYLKGKDYPGIVIANVICKLEKYNYINDEAFATDFAASAGKSRSIRRIKSDLMRMGLDEGLIAEKLENFEGQDAAADKAAAKYLRSRPFDRQKLAAHLGSKGFDWDIVRGAVDRASGEADMDDECGGESDL